MSFGFRFICNLCVMSLFEILKNLLNNNDAGNDADESAICDKKGNLIGTHGQYGLTHSNPIPIKSINDGPRFMDHLRSVSGAGIKYCLDSAFQASFNTKYTAYAFKVIEGGHKENNIIYLCPNGLISSEKAPEGYILVDDSKNQLAQSYKDKDNKIYSKAYWEIREQIFSLGTDNKIDHMTYCNKEDLQTHIYRNLFSNILLKDNDLIKSSINNGDIIYAAMNINYYSMHYGMCMLFQKIDSRREFEELNYFKAKEFFNRIVLDDPIKVSTWFINRYDVGGLKSMMDSLDESLANITMAIIATRGKDDLPKYMVAMGQAFIDLGMATAKMIMRNYELRIL